MVVAEAAATARLRDTEPWPVQRAVLCPCEAGKWVVGKSLQAGIDRAPADERIVRVTWRAV
jgi:hypothetical protein